MTKNEAFLAVQFNSICESGGISYYAYGLEHIHEPGKKPREAIILHDLKANSITHAEYSKTAVIDWKAPEWLVKERLEKLNEKTKSEAT